jgi:hypothetical protein
MSATQISTVIAYCLADFFNLRLWPMGREVRFPDVRDGLDELVDACLRAAPEAREITFRLYGGWHGDVPQSRVSLRDLTAKVVRQMALRAGSTRLRCELAESPAWDKSMRLLRTVREVRLNYVTARLEEPPSCIHAGGTSCSITVLGRWCSGRCPEPTCSVRLRDVAHTHRQKMVDTLMTADAVYLGRDDGVDMLIIASDDDDMLPALLALTTSSQKIIKMSRSNGPADYYRGILERDGITFYAW